MSEQPSALRLNAEGLEVAYDNFVALRCEKMDARGRVVALLGHNGAGKSTFIKTILGLLAPKKGSLRITHVNGGPETQLVPERHMAFCPETGSVFADISVESYIRLWCRMKHKDSNYYKKAGSKYIELLSIAPLLSKLGRELSKGQRRRVQTAIGFLTSPRLFLFDEPFDGLDVQKTNELADIIVDESQDTTFVISSHRMDVVERLADVLIVLKEGTFLTYGGIDQVCRDLCEKSVIVGRLEKHAEALHKLRDRFPSCLVNHVGSQICVTGHNFTIEELRTFLDSESFSNADLQPIRPSLVDAMNCHLKTTSLR